MRAVAPALPKWLPALVLAAASAALLPPRIDAQRSNKVCTFDGGTAMAFGAYDSMRNSPLDAQGRVSYRCYNEKSNSTRSGTQPPETRDKLIVQITINAGNAGSFNRYMNGQGERLHYNLYLDPQRQTVWGDGTGGTQFYSEHGQPNNHVVTVPVYGRVFGAQDVSAGSYFDQLVVTLDF